MKILWLKNSRYAEIQNLLASMLRIRDIKYLIKDFQFWFWRKDSLQNFWKVREKGFNSLKIVSDRNQG